MGLEEEGTVVELRGGYALVRAVPSPQCAGCASSGVCHGGASRNEKVVEAHNEIGAVPGDRVTIAIPSGTLLKAAFRVYMLPVAGILAGAGAAQVAVQALGGAEGAGGAAGLGGLAGAALVIAAQRVLGRRKAKDTTLRPRIIRVL